MTELEQLRIEYEEIAKDLEALAEEAQEFGVHVKMDKEGNFYGELADEFARVADRMRRFNVRFDNFRNRQLN